MYAISGSKIFTPDNVLENYSVVIDQDQIINLSPCDKSNALGSHRIIDVSDMFIVPGFIDLQINGAFGVDFTADLHYRDVLDILYKIALKEIPRIKKYAFCKD